MKISLIIANLIFLKQVKLKQQLQAIENDPLLDNTEKARRKEALILQHTRGTTGLGVGPCTLYSPVSQAPSGCLAPSLSTMSPLAPAFYPPANTVESVVGEVSTAENLDSLTFPQHSTKNIVLSLIISMILNLSAHL